MQRLAVGSGGWYWELVYRFKSSLFKWPKLTTKWLTDRLRGCDGFGALGPDQKTWASCPQNPTADTGGWQKGDPTQALDDFLHCIFGTGPAKQDHEVCTCVCLQGTAAHVPQQAVGPRQDGQGSVALQPRQEGTSFPAGVRCKGVPPTQSQKEMDTLSYPQSWSKSKFDERLKAKLNTNYFHKQNWMEMGWTLMNPQSSYIVEWKNMKALCMHTYV